MKIGFIGLGMMGGGMAANLVKAGHTLAVHDLRREIAQPLLDAGAAWADTVGDAARDADVVFTSLPGPKEMQEVGVGEGGLLASMRSGAVWVDLSTNSPTVVRKVAARCAERGIELLDAPVSGGPSGARSGKLAIYVGGDAAVFERCRPLLDAIGDQAMYVGPVGAGNCAKLAHNCASFTTRMAIAEIFTLGVKAGVEPLALWHALRQGSTGRARTFARTGDQCLQERYEAAACGLKLAHKDLSLALELAHEFDLPMKLAEATLQDFTAALERGWGERDSRSPMSLQNERAGVTIKVSAEDVKKTIARD